MATRPKKSKPKIKKESRPAKQRPPRQTQRAAGQYSAENRARQKKTVGHSVQNFDLPRNRVLLYGRNSVEAALSNPNRGIGTIFASPKMRDWLSGCTINASWLDGKAISFDADAPVFRHLDNQAVPHQGVAAVTAPLPDLALEDVLDDAATHEMILMLDQVTDPQNVGAALRVAAGLGATAVVTQDRHSPSESGALARAAAGALETQPWIKVANLSQALKQLSQYGFWSLGLAGEAGQSIFTSDPAPRMVIVIGSEGKGLRPLVRENCDQLVTLPMSKRIESYNASIAGALALQAIEMKRGMYAALEQT